MKLVDPTGSGCPYTKLLLHTTMAPYDLFVYVECNFVSNQELPALLFIIS